MSNETLPAPPKAPTALLAAYLAGEGFRPLSTARRVQELAAGGVDDETPTGIDF